MAGRYFVVLMALVCALGATALSGCGGSGAASSSSAAGGSSASSSTASAAATDEELVKADLEKTIGTYVSKETLLEALKSDQQLAAYADMGVDLEAYAENMSKVMKFEVTSVDVNGDTAVAHTALTLPDFGTASDQLVTEKMQEMAANVDVTKMTQEEQVSFLMQVLSAVLSDPAFPTTTTTMDVDYTKKDGTWAAVDGAAVEQAINNAGTAAAGV